LKPHEAQRQTACMRYISAPHRSHITFEGSDPGSDAFRMSVTIGRGRGLGGGVGAGESGMWVGIIAFPLGELTASGRAAKPDACMGSDTSSAMLS